MPVAVVCGRLDPAVHHFQTSKSFADPVVGALSLREARNRLRDGLNHLPELPSELAGKAPEALAGEPRWSLVLEHEEPLNTAIRAHFSQAAQWSRPPSVWPRLWPSGSPSPNS